MYAPFAYLMYITALSITVRNMNEKIDEVAMTKKLDDRSTNEKNVIGTANPTTTGTSKLLKNALLIHLVGWYVQIHPGHAIYEGAKPAVLDSFASAITSAPLFAYYEGLWFVGLNKGLQEKTLFLVDVHTKELCQEGAQLRACEEYD